MRQKQRSLGSGAQGPWGAAKCSGASSAAPAWRVWSSAEGGVLNHDIPLAEMQRTSQVYFPDRKPIYLVRKYLYVCYVQAAGSDRVWSCNAAPDRAFQWFMGNDRGSSPETSGCRVRDLLLLPQEDKYFLWLYFNSQHDYSCLICLFLQEIILAKSRPFPT